MNCDHSNIPTHQSPFVIVVFFPFTFFTSRTRPSPKPGTLDPGPTGSRQDLAPEIQVRSRGSELIQTTLRSTSPSLMATSVRGASMRSKHERSQGKLLEGKLFSTNFLYINLSTNLALNINLCAYDRSLILEQTKQKSDIFLFHNCFVFNKD